jgi:hypothetical protein
VVEVRDSAGKPVPYQEIVRTGITNADTTLYVGASVDVVTAAVDACGNQSGGAKSATLELSSSAVVIESGNRVRAQQIGSAYVRALTNGQAVDSVLIGVAPQGEILAARPHNGYMQPVIFNLDGSNVRVASAAADALQPLSFTPAWIPGSTRFAFTDLRGIYVTLTNGSLRRLHADSTLWESPGFPALSPDGAWLYFAIDHSSYIYRIWRSKLDGTQLQPFGEYGQQEVQPTLSANGDRFAFLFLLPSFEAEIRVRNIATGAVTVLPYYADEIRWSPTDEWIAYRKDREIFLVRPDGTAQHQISPAGIPYGCLGSCLTWSRDGKYLLVARLGPTFSADFLLEIIEIATGTRIPLPYTEGWRGAAWH